jgi:DNA-binding response OmpR family regulator
MTATILVVDDEPSIVKLVTATLEKRGYEIIPAFDGEEALAKVKSHHVDLILLDIMMPHLDGREVRKRLLADPVTHDIPVIHLSAVGDFEQQLNAVEDGATDYITKPFVPSELADRVKDFLNPEKRDQLLKEHKQKEAKLRTMVEIMHRRREQE